MRELAAHGRASWAPGAAPNYLSAAAIALQAWVAWRDERLDQAHALAIEALELWGAQPGLWPFQCLALWPLAVAHLDAGQVDEAVGAARRLLEPSQARLPDELEAAVHAACAAWDQADLELAGQLLADAVELGYA